MTTHHTPAAFLTDNEIEDARAEAFGIWHRQLATRAEAIQAQMWAHKRLLVIIYTRRAGAAAKRGDAATARQCMAEAYAASDRARRITAEIDTPKLRRPKP